MGDEESLRYNRIRFDRINYLLIAGKHPDYFNSLKVGLGHLRKLFSVNFDLTNLEQYSFKLQRIVAEDRFRKEHLAQYYSLTKREKEILRMIALGKNNQQISEQLFLSKDTVRTHRNNIWHKLGINSLIDVIRYAQAFDLI
jgi:DNA-binding CsgD family transcriptional regulator